MNKETNAYLETQATLSNLIEMVYTNKTLLINLIQEYFVEQYTQKYQNIYFFKYTQNVDEG